MDDAECVDFIQLERDYFQRLSDFIWLACIFNNNHFNTNLLCRWKLLTFQISIMIYWYLFKIISCKGLKKFSH